jgi:RNA polymerase sigma factor (sigma-70 family)
MKPAELEGARLGFNQYLRRKGISPQFIERHAEDLFATATLEYSRKLAEGDEIESPAGWLIACAWQRTKSQLETEARQPRTVSTEHSGPLADGNGNPEDALLHEDRFRRVREAVGGLSIDQRRLLALSYFEDFTVREAARELRWHPSKAQRAHEGAKRRLHELLGARSADELAVEVGLAAYLSLAARASRGGRLPGIHAALDRASQKAAEGVAALKQQAATAYYRAVDPTPLATARPGTVASVLASCLAIGGGATTYCLEQGIDPIGAARGLIASAPQEKKLPPNERASPPPAPTYTPVESPPQSEKPPAAEAASPAGEASPQPESKPVHAPASDSYEPVRPAYMAREEAEATEISEAPEEPAPVESARPAPVAAGAGPQFGGP